MVDWLCVGGYSEDGPCGDIDSESGETADQIMDKEPTFAELVNRLYLASNPLTPFSEDA